MTENLSAVIDWDGRYDVTFERDSKTERIVRVILTGTRFHRANPRYELMPTTDGYLYVGPLMRYELELSDGRKVETDSEAEADHLIRDGARIVTTTTA
jgi:hypothetical protein